jgi:hypothetical protein
MIAVIGTVYVAQNHNRRDFISSDHSLRQRSADCAAGKNAVIAPPDHNV